MVAASHPWWQPLRQGGKRGDREEERKELAIHDVCQVQGCLGLLVSPWLEIRGRKSKKKLCDVLIEGLLMISFH